MTLTASLCCCLPLQFKHFDEIRSKRRHRQSTRIHSGNKNSRVSEINAGVSNLEGQITGVEQQATESRHHRQYIRLWIKTKQREEKVSVDTFTFSVTLPVYPWVNIETAAFCQTPPQLIHQQWSRARSASSAADTPPGAQREHTLWDMTFAVCHHLTFLPL